MGFNFCFQNSEPAIFFPLRNENSVSGVIGIKIAYFTIFHAIGKFLVKYKNLNWNVNMTKNIAMIVLSVMLCCRVNSDLNEGECEVLISRAINLPCPDGAKPSDMSTYAKWSFPWPSVSS